ncbi:MAG: hypothetical protein ACYDC6_15580, partial [Acidobacteriaceae bacterium]
AEKWKDDYAIEGVADLELHHLYRAMAWLGESLPQDQQDGATPFAPRTNKDRIEEALFARRRDLFSDLEIVFFDTTSIYFEGEGGETIGQHRVHLRPDRQHGLVAALPLLDLHMLPHAGRHAQGEERLHHQRHAAPCGQGFLQWLIINLKQQRRFGRRRFPGLERACIVIAFFPSQVQKNRPRTSIHPLPATIHAPLDIYGIFSPPTYRRIGGSEIYVDSAFIEA